MELGSSIHHARIYRIDGKKTAYAMVRVFQVDLMRMKHQDVLTTPLKPSAISMRTAEPKIRQALANGTATQIGWLVEGDELRIDTSKYRGGFIGEVLERYPEATSWRVAGFPTSARLRLRPYLLSAEGLDKDADKAMKDLLEGSGWRPSVNVVFSSGTVEVVRRNCLAEPRYGCRASLPTSFVVE